jgi:hypothetical protein
MTQAPELPARIADLAALEELMSRPSPELVRALQQAPGDIMVLGVGGKMGPTLARMAKRAVPDRRVIGVARFTEPDLRERLQADGVECIRGRLAVARGTGRAARRAQRRLHGRPQVRFQRQ